MNVPIARLFEDGNGKESFWWPVQWDPAYWLDKVFSKFEIRVS